MEIKPVRNVKELENIFIPMSDGCRLAARIWMPDNARREPVPAILEYLPYRKRDGTVDRDEMTHPYFASHGYACIRVDMRGSGESDGLMFDEYTSQEQDDALAVIQWIADQPWCTGKVGMIGISWGGFNGLQVAARRPPSLAAVVSICSTDDRYADDIHYMGGCLLNYNLGWATTMLAYSVRPPDPLLVGERWRDMWRERLENLPFLAQPWLTHQHRDNYWKHGSICENYGDIQVPVFLVGGWADGYTNTIFRMMEGLNCPRKALVGPWAHKYPHFAKPGPQVGFLQECLRWWDRWLKGVDTGVMADAPLRLYMQESLPPKSQFKEVPGRWVAEPSWPSPNVSEQVYYLGANVLRDMATGGEMTIASPQTVGARGGRWFAFGTGPELPVDQRSDDQGSLFFDSEPLADRLEICGAPVVELKLASDRPCALLAARLCDLRPDGSISRISYGVLNLTHHASHEHPEALVPGRWFTIRLKMNEIAWALAPGHRLRLSLSNAYWPLVWPSAQSGSLTIALEDSRLHLPARSSRQENIPELPSPESSPPPEQVVLRPDRLEWTIDEAATDGTLTTRNLDDYGERIISAHGLRTSLKGSETWRIRPADPLSARADLRWQMFTGRDAWQVSGDVCTAMWADEAYFYMTAHVQAFEDGAIVFNKSWNSRIKRNLV